MDSNSDKTVEEYISYLQSVKANRKTQTISEDNSSESADFPTTKLLNSSSVNESVQQLLHDIKEDEIESEDTAVEQLPTETISSRELELQQDLEHKKSEIHKLNESIKNFQKILSEKDKNICFLMRTQEETIECHSKEKKELQEQIEKLQNDSWTNLSPSPELVSVFVQTESPKTKDKEDFNKAMIKLKLELKQKTTEWTNERRGLNEEIKSLKNKLNVAVKDNTDLAEKLEKKSVSSSDSIEIVESLTNQEKFEIAKFNKQIFDISTQTDAYQENENKNFVDKINQLISENSQKDAKIVYLETEVKTKVDENTKISSNVNYLETLMKDLTTKFHLESFEAVLDKLEDLDFENTNLRSDLQQICNKFDAKNAAEICEKNMDEFFEKFHYLQDENNTLKNRCDQHENIFRRIFEKFNVKDIEEVFRINDKSVELQEKVKKLVVVLRKRGVEIDELKRSQCQIIETLSSKLAAFTSEFPIEFTERCLETRNKFVLIENKVSTLIDDKIRVEREVVVLRNRLAEKESIIEEMNSIRYRDCATETDQCVCMDQDEYYDLLARIANLESALNGEEVLKAETQQLISDMQLLVDQHQSLRRMLDNYRNHPSEETIGVQDVLSPGPISSSISSHIPKLPIIPENEQEDVTDVSCASFFKDEVIEPLCVKRDMYKCGPNDDSGEAINQSNLTSAFFSDNEPVLDSTVPKLSQLEDEVRQILFENDQMKKSLEQYQISTKNLRQKTDIEHKMLVEKHENELFGLNEKLSKLQEINEDLNQKLIEFEKIKEMITLQESKSALIDNECSRVIEECEALKKNLEAVRVECQQFKDCNDNLKLKCATLQEQIDTNDNAMSQMQSEIQMLNENFEKSQIENSAVLDNFQTLTDHYDRLRSYSCELETSLAETKQNMEENSKAQQKVFDEKIESLEFDKVQLERSFESERISFHSEIESLKKENYQLKNSIESLQRHLDAEMTEKAKFQKLFDTKSENFDNLMNNFAKTENQLQNQIKVYNEIINDNEILRAKLQQVEEKNAILCKDFESLKMLKEALESEKNDICEKYEVVTNEVIENLKQEISDLKVQNGELNQRLQMLDVEKKNLLANYDDQKMLTKSLEVERIKLFTNLKSVTNQKEAVEKDFEALKIDVQSKMETKDKEIANLNQIVEQLNEENELSKEYLENRIDNLKNALRKDSELVEGDVGAQIQRVKTELDLALYMLHQRDVRCDELMLELTNLLQERDTLQLRLSDALRVNEDLKINQVANATISDDLSDNLQSKLNELQSISHSKDINFKDERELRRAQQISFMSEHRNVASQLPEEAVNKLTSFSNVQSGSSTEVTDSNSSSSILEWLWGTQKGKN